MAARSAHSSRRLNEYERYLELRRRSAKVYEMESLPDGLRADFERGLSKTEAVLKDGRYKGPKE